MGRQDKLCRKLSWLHHKSRDFLRETRDDSCVAFNVRLFTLVPSRLTLRGVTGPIRPDACKESVPKMPKKKTAKLDKQLNVRVSDGIYLRVEQTANQLGIDPSDLVRMLLAENLPVYEERARKTAEPKRDPPRSAMR